MINSRSIKLIGIAVMFIIVSLGVWFGTSLIDPQTQEAKEERAMQEYWDDLTEQYENDTYGGSTPEETIALFISALEVGDIELASKYFVIDEQEEQLEYLVGIQKKELIERLISVLENSGDKYPLVEGNNDRFIFEFFDNEKELILQIDLAVTKNNIWKILDM